MMATAEACNLLVDQDCAWVWRAGKCEPPLASSGACLPRTCGFFSCECERAPSSMLPPWTVLNVSAMACPAVIKASFINAALQLHPDKNPGCRDLADAEFVAALRARDTMLALAPWMQNGAVCDSEEDQRHSQDWAFELESDANAELQAMRNKKPLVQHAWSFLKNQARSKWSAVKGFFQPALAAFRSLTFKNWAIATVAVFVQVLLASKI